jgi:hypothetical protein
LVYCIDFRSLEDFGNLEFITPYNPSATEYRIMMMCKLNPEAIAASFGALRLIKAHAQGSSMVPRLATLWIGNILQNAVNAKANNISRIPRFKSMPLTR